MTQGSNGFVPHDVEREGERKVVDSEKLHYTLTEVPPVPILIGAAFQHLLMNLAYGLAATFIVSNVLCASYDSPIRTRLFSSTLLMSGICTLLQTGLGIRLPVYQGPSSSFFPALLALNSISVWQCTPSPVSNSNSTSVLVNLTNLGNQNNTPMEVSLTEEQRLQQLSGSLMASSFFEIIIGATGLVGFLLRYIGPITVGPTIALIGISLCKIPIEQSRSSWEISFAGIVLVLVFALYIRHIKIPLPMCGRKGERSYLRLFELLPILVSMLVMWGVSGILTITNVFPNDPSTPRYRARTDSKMSLLDEAPWFQVPYPGQFGVPSFNLAAFIGFLTGFVASIIESVGDYFAVANACQVDPPPDHAVSRGILMEGIGALIGGAVGTAHATTSYSPNISAVTITKTASRSVMLCCGFMLMLFSVLGKFGAAIVMIPDPVLAGVLVILSGMLIAIGLSTLRHVNMNSARNITIVGVALFLGIFLPEWVERYPDFINTGVREVDSVLQVAVGTPMFVGGVFGFILDNTVRGTRKDRGLTGFRQKRQESCTSTGEHYISVSEAYGWHILPRIYKRCRWLASLPFMPPLPEDPADTLEFRTRSSDYQAVVHEYDFIP